MGQYCDKFIIEHFRDKKVIFLQVNLNPLPKLENWICCRIYYNKSVIKTLAKDRLNYKLMGTNHLLKLMTTNKLNHILIGIRCKWECFLGCYVPHTLKKFSYQNSFLSLSNMVLSWPNFLGSRFFVTCGTRNDL